MFTSVNVYMVASIDLAFKIKYGYKLELKTYEITKLLGSTKKINRQNKKWRKSTNS